MLVPYVFALDRLDIYVRGTGHHTARRAVRRTRTGVLQLIFPGAVHAFQHVLPWDKFSIKHRKMVISYVSKISTALAAMLLDRCSVKKTTKTGVKGSSQGSWGYDCNMVVLVCIIVLLCL